ncbi:MAG: hypothetical protein OHK0017_04790 [Patescibacteria group bacterium]
MTRTHNIFPLIVVLILGSLSILSFSLVQVDAQGDSLDSTPLLSSSSSSGVTSSSSSSSGSTNSSSSSSSSGSFNTTPTENAPEVTTPDTQVRDVTEQTFEGEVTKIDSQKLTVKNDDTTREFTVPSGISVKRNTLDANLSDIQPNDRVKVTYSGDGQVLSIDATASQVFDYSKIGIPAVILILIILGVIAYLIRRSRKGHIKTTTVSKS